MSCVLEIRYLSENERVSKQATYLSFGGYILYVPAATHEEQIACVAHIISRTPKWEIVAQLGGMVLS